MTKIFAFLSLWLFVSQFLLFAQDKNYQFESGKDYYVPMSTVVPSQMIGLDETGYYFLVFNKKETSQIWIEHFDKKLNKTKSQKLVFLKGQSNRKFEYIYYSNDKIYLFSSYPDYKLKKRFLEVQTVDKHTLLVNNDLKSITEIDNTFNSSGKFEFSSSANGEKVLIYCDYPEEKEKQEGKTTTSDRYKFLVFEKDAKLLWSKEIIFPYNEKLFSVESYTIDNQGRLLFSGILFNDTISAIIRKSNGIFGGSSSKELIAYAEKKGIKFNYIVLGYDGHKEDLFQYKIEIEEKFLHDMKLVANQNEDLICTGFYSDKGYKSIKGIFYIKFDNNEGKIKQKNIHEFPKEIILSGLSEYQVKEAERKMQKGESVEMKKYELNNLVNRADGSITLLAEQYVEEQENVVVPYYTLPRCAMYSSGNFGIVPTTGGYFPVRNSYNDIMVIYLNSDGKVNWIKLIPKKQKSTSDNFISYGLASTETDLYLFFNDTALNYDPKWKDKPYTYTGNIERPSVLVLVKIDPEGEVRMEPTVSSRELNITLKPKGCIQIDNHSILLFSQKNSRLTLNKMTFK